MFNSPYASLDSAQVRRRLEAARQKDVRSLHALVTDCFFEGSVAAAEAAALFIIEDTDSLAKARTIAEVLKPLPGAVPIRNARSLVRAVVFLALNFGDPECVKPLNSCCYAEVSVKEIAIHGVVSSVSEVVRSQPSKLDAVLKRYEVFFGEMLGAGSEPHQRLLAVKGLFDIGSLGCAPSNELLVSFFLKLLSDQSGSEEEGDVDAENEYASFVTSELARLSTGNEQFSQVLRWCLARALEFSVACGIHALWTGHSSKVRQVLPSVGYDAFVYVLMSVAAKLACEGRIFETARTLAIVLAAFENSEHKMRTLHVAVSTCARATCVALGSAAAAAGAKELASYAMEIRRNLGDEKDWQDIREPEALQSTVGMVCGVAQQCSYSNAVVCLGVLLKFASLWWQPRALLIWLKDDFSLLVGAARFECVNESERTRVEEPRFKKRQPLDSSGGDAWDNDETQLDVHETDRMLTRLTFACTVVAGLSHSQSRIRYCAAYSFTQQGSKETLFFLPAVVHRLEQETNGAVAALCLRSSLMSPCLLSFAATSEVALSVLLRLVRPGTAKDPTPSYHTGLVAFADAVETAPAVATSVLLEEVQRLQDAFGFISPQCKAATCAAILRVSSLRPTRATNMIPFLSQCLSKESAESAPETLGFCFKAMSVMADEGVLDPVKAVKIVLKGFPDVLSVTRKARRSYIHLLGSVASAATSRKGRVVAGKVIAVLRKCVTEVSPKNKGKEYVPVVEVLTGEQIGTAAMSLAKYSVDDILRIVHTAHEPFLDPEDEKERLEAIERDCMRFTQGLLSTCSAVKRNGPGASPALETLLHVIVEDEWKNRPRSKFDIEKMAKLKATSEALRRARGSIGGDSEKDKAGTSDPLGEFLRAAQLFPPGVIRAVCERCGTSPDSEVLEENANNRGADARAIAMMALLKGKALSPALPWTPFLEDILRSDARSDRDKACALAVLARLDGVSHGAAECHRKWFGPSSPLLSGARLRDGVERELFLGMVLHNPEGTRHQLRHYWSSVTPDTLSALIEGTAAFDAQSMSFSESISALLDVFRSGQLTFLGPELERVLAKFTQVCLLRLSAADLEELLKPANSDVFTDCEAIQAQLVAEAGNFALFRKYVHKLLRCPSATHVSIMKPICRAVGNLLEEQRNAVLYDLCGVPSALSGELHDARLILAIHCLGTSALLPDKRLALAAAPGVCTVANRIPVTRLIKKLGG